jgi:hypothetical protein
MLFVPCFHVKKEKRINKKKSIELQEKITFEWDGQESNKVCS